MTHMTLRPIEHVAEQFRLYTLWRVRHVRHVRHKLASPCGPCGFSERQQALPAHIHLLAQALGTPCGGKHLAVVG
jgi:hypothetical protein